MIKLDAIVNVTPNCVSASFLEDGTFVAVDEHGNKLAIDEQAVLNEEERLKAERALTVYQVNRQPEYPALADLADALYWSNQGDNTKLDEYYAAVSAVKTKYPKPEVSE